MSNIKGALLARGFKEYSYGELIGDCPSCGKKGHFGVNYAKLIAHCYRCDYSLNPKNIFKELRITGEEVFNFKPMPKFAAEVPFIPPKIGDLSARNFSARAVRSYLLGRGFTLEYSKMMRWGYGTEEYHDRVIIPFYETGSLVYFQARAISPAKLKIMNPPKAGSLGKANYLYNIDSAKNYRSIVVCEGWADAASIGLNAVSMQGKKISKIQQMKLLSMEPEEVIICLDSKADEAAYSLASMLSGSIDSVKVAHLENREDGEENDPNSISYSKLQKALSTAEQISTRSLIMAKFGK